MPVQDTLIQAMHLPPTRHRPADPRVRAGRRHADTMSQAIHDVYCGIMADHQHPNEKDKEQARALLAALQKHATAGSEATGPLVSSERGRTLAGVRSPGIWNADHGPCSSRLTACGRSLGMDQLLRPRRWLGS